MHETSDGVLVCCHNSSLKKMYGEDVRIEEHPFRELSSLTLVAGNGLETYAPRLLRLPLFEEYLNICERGGCVPFIETKGNVVEQVLRLLEKRGMTERAVLSSIEFPHIEQARAISSRIFVHHIFSDEEKMERLAAFGNSGLSYNYPVLDEVPAGLIGKTHRAGVRVCLRAGDDPGTVRRMTAMQLVYIPTNRMTNADIPLC